MHTVSTLSTYIVQDLLYACWICKFNCNRITLKTKRKKWALLKIEFCACSGWKQGYTACHRRASAYTHTHTQYFNHLWKIHQCCAKWTLRFATIYLKLLKILNKKFFKYFQILNLKKKKKLINYFPLIISRKQCLRQIWIRPFHLRETAAHEEGIFKGNLR